MAQFKVQEREYQLRRDEVQKKFHTELTRKKSHEKQAQHAALRRERWVGQYVVGHMYSSIYTVSLKIVAEIV